MYIEYDKKHMPITCTQTLQCNFFRNITANILVTKTP